MARKVVYTETVTAEVLPSMPPLRPASRGEPAPPRQHAEPSGAPHGGRDAVAGAISDAIASTDVQVLGAAPSMSLGEQITAMSTGLSHAAHNAAAFQINSSTLHGASTVRAVATILGGAPVTVKPRRRSRA